jgi:hypothetical protein
MRKAMLEARSIGRLPRRGRARWTGAVILPIVVALLLPAGAEAADDGWQFTFAPYLLAASMGGTTGVRGFEAEVDMSASDIFSNLEMGFNGYLGAQKGDWGFGVDVIYMALGASTEFVEVDPSQAAFTFLVSRRVAPTLDVTLGARWNVIRSRLEFRTNSAAFPGTTVEDTYQWVDPVIGIAWRQPIGRRWIFGLPANLGGFGISSKIAVDVFPNVQFQLTKRAWIGAGWRLLYVNYETGYDDGPPILDSDSFLYEVTSTGPVIGLLIRF